METVLTIISVFWTIYLYAGAVVLTFFLWGFYRNFKRINSIVETTQRTVEQLNEVKLVYIETINGVHYMYDFISRAFICQAASEDELWECARAKFPNKDILLTENTVKE